MSVSVYSTASLIGIVSSLRSRNRSTFMLDMFFNQYVAPTGQREIAFDVEDDVLGIAPFVSPLKEGKIVSEAGYTTKYFTPAYIKPKMPLNPFGPVSRMMGEAIGGVLKPAQREAARVAKGFDDLFGMVVRRLELMAIDALIDGIVTVTGEGYDAVAVNFGRAAGQSIALSSPNRWYDSNISPVANLDTWIMTVAASTGVSPDRVVMDAKAWALYEADPKFDKRRDKTLGTLGSGTNSSPGMSRAPVKGGILKATLDGGAVEIWVYQQVYKTEAGAAANMIPDYSVFVGCSDERCQGTRHFGTILDPSLNYDSSALVDPDSGAILEFAPKTWVTDDPAQRFLMLQCAPLTALTRPNATLYALVG